MKPSDPEFERLRPRLRRIAYRMLGSTADAEDVVQDAWLRWSETRPDIQNAEAWLVAVTTRLAIDRLRAAKVRREHYVGTWLPEPLLEESPPTPEQTLELADDVSVAFLRMLERLAPEARAAFLLREVFDFDYDRLALTLEKSQAACRQLVHRAKEQLREAKPRFAVSFDTQRRLLQGFAQAATQGDFAALTSMLTEDAELISDGGGKVPSFGKPLIGGRRIAQLFYAARRRLGGAIRMEIVPLNGEWGLLRLVDGKLEAAYALETDGERIVRIHSQRNPDKLAPLATAMGID